MNILLIVALTPRFTRRAQHIKHSSLAGESRAICGQVHGVVRHTATDKQSELNAHAWPASRQRRAIEATLLRIPSGRLPLPPDHPLSSLAAPS
jgi:hypothetical protein